MTPKPPNYRQLSEMFDEMRRAIDDLESGARVETFDEITGKSIGYNRTPNAWQMIGLAAAARRDGYPTSSRAAEGGPGSVLDDQGDPMPPLSDPTGELASADQRTVDPIWHHTQSVVRGLTGALGDIRMARSSLIRGSQYTQTQAGEPGCSSHQRVHIWEAVDRNGRCRWCYGFWNEHGIDPPTELLHARVDGRRITEKMVTDALRSRPGPKKKRRVA